MPTQEEYVLLGPHPTNLTAFHQFDVWVLLLVFHTESLTLPQVMEVRCQEIGVPTASHTVSIAPTSRQPRCAHPFSPSLPSDLRPEAWSSERVRLRSHSFPLDLYSPLRYVESLENRLEKMEKLLQKVGVSLPFLSHLLILPRSVPMQISHRSSELA